VRVRSGDPRAAIAASRAQQGGSPAAESDESDDSDGDCGPGRGGGQPVQWKADVRSLVQDFAREQRDQERRKGKPGAAGGGGGSGPAQQRKPPRAPAPQPKAPESPAPEPAPKREPRRHVEYTPATVGEYRERYGEKGEKTELGHLGPDLDDEGLLMKRAVQEKVKQFSRELHRINKQRQTQAPPKPKAKAEPEPTKRAKALEFAQGVPKPKVAPRPQLVVERKAPSAAGAEMTRRASGGSADDEQEDWAEIQRREKQHFEDVAKVAEIREFISNLAV